MEKKVTINDVAVRAGVAKSTVSRVFSPGESVSDRTRHRVMEVARELGYEPDPLARALSSSRTGTIAIVVPNMESVHISQIIRGIMSVMTREGYSIITVDTSENYGLEAPVIKPLSHQLVDGLINCYSAADSEIARVAASKPVVCVGDRPDSYPADFLSIDYRKGYRLMAAHLRSQGVRRLHMIQGRETSNTRHQGDLFVEQAREEGFSLDETGVWYGNWTPFAGYDAMRRLLKEPDPPDAVVFASDFMAFGALRAVAEAGLQVPGDLRICGLDDSLISKYTLPALTTLKFSPFRLGMEAAQMLLARFRDPEAGTMEKILPVELEIRDSSGPVRVRDQD